MYELGLYHSDIKPANMMVKETNGVRLLQLIDVDTMSNEVRDNAGRTFLYTPGFINLENKITECV